MMTATLLIIISTAIFLLWERIAPGRVLPNSVGWYVRALLINLVQLSITLATGQLWLTILSDQSLLGLQTIGNPMLEGFIGWFVGTFVFYWWHRLRHKKGFWLVFHQIHHSA